MNSDADAEVEMFEAAESYNDCDVAVNESMRVEKYEDEEIRNVEKVEKVEKVENENIEVQKAKDKLEMSATCQKIICSASQGPKTAKLKQRCASYFKISVKIYKTGS